MPLRYRSSDEDSARWDGFAFRDGDLVVSTRSKHGATWTQAILLMLVHGTDHLPDRLDALSPWLDHLAEPRDLVWSRLAAQPHRRVAKTHTPLDGIPLDPRATYVVVARHPLDAAVSLYHQGANIDRDRLQALTDAPDRRPRPPRPDLGPWLSSWIHDSEDPRTHLDSLDGVLHHVRDAWVRRQEPNVVLVHYADLQADLAGAVARLAERLDLPAPPDLAQRIAAATSFDTMRARAEQLAPDTLGVLRDREAFFRGGVSGAGEAAASDRDLAHYRRRVAAQLDPDLDAWLHR